jgi:hypothetical protein
LRAGAIVGNLGLPHDVEISAFVLTLGETSACTVIRPRCALATQASGNWPGISLPPLLLSTKADTVRAERRLRDVDGINTFRCIRRSFHVISRRFACSDSAFPQVTLFYAAGSIPGSSTERDPGQSGALWPGSYLVYCRVALDVSALLEV